MIDFNCPHCETPIQVPDEAAGKPGKCVKCQQRIRVPSLPPPFPREGSETPSSSLPAAVLWHVHTHQGQRAGPVDQAQLNQWIAEDRLTAECLVWQEGWDEWKRAAEMFAGLPSPAPERPAHDPRGFLASLGSEAAQSPVVAIDNTVTAPSAQQYSVEPAATAGYDLGTDRRLVASLAGTRPWMMLFAVSACVLATIIMVGLIYVFGKLGGRIPSTLIIPLIVSALQMFVLYAAGVLALMYNARIGEFIRTGSPSRLTGALDAQRTLWALLSIVLTVFTLYVIYLLIQVIQFVNTMSDVADRIPTPD